MRIAICDDNLDDIGALKKAIKSHKNPHELFIFTSAQDFLTHLSNGLIIDLLFLDVEMPDGDGWNIAKQIKAANLKIFIAMLTIHGDYIFNCFDRVDWFTIKPFAVDSIHKILDVAHDRLYPTVFSFQVDKVTLTLTAPEIIYFEVQRNIVTIHTTTGIYSIRMTLKAVRNMLAPYPQFVQVHNSFLINLDYYNSYSGGEIILKSNDKIKLSRSFRQQFFQALANYVGAH
ncbi:MAG: LytTR family DNA-binding domain-containing protein [Lachnospiraceae bacterium]|nr:LytTR family DNA-binding domain-containing protein [Lachnospiraceae bacterium]